MSGTIHEMLQERMPEVARGTTDWDPSETAHLAGCAECGAEWALIRAAAKGGAGIERDFDVARAAHAVTERLRHHRPLHRRPAVRTLIGLAAAAAIAFVFLRPVVPTPTAPAATEARLLPELDSLNVEELTLLADAIEPPLAETPLGADPALTDLDSTQLTRVLRSLEG